MRAACAAWSIQNFTLGSPGTNHHLRHDPSKMSRWAFINPKLLTWLSWPFLTLFVFLHSLPVARVLLLFLLLSCFSLPSPQTSRRLPQHHRLAQPLQFFLQILDESHQVFLHQAVPAVLQLAAEVSGVGIDFLEARD